MTDIWQHPNPFILRVTVGPEHQDGLGHTNNQCYLAWMEQVAWAHSEALGLGLATYQAMGTACVARRHEMDYLAATRAGDVLQLETWVQDNDGRLGMWRGFRFVRVADQRVVFAARTHWVCIDFASGRPKRQPPEFIAAYCSGRGAVNSET